MAFIKVGRVVSSAVSSQNHFVDVFRNKLLQLQRGGRIASRIDLEIESSEEPTAQSRDSLPVSIGLDTDLMKLGNRATPCLGCG